MSSGLVMSILLVMNLASWMVRSVWIKMLMCLNQWKSKRGLYLLRMKIVRVCRGTLMA
ncbi:hypothetical protein CsSME_00004753 [Camellia sinensis var. sinensis]